MTAALLILAAPIFASAPRPGDAADIFRLSDVTLAGRPDEMHDWRFWSGEVRLGPGLIAPAEIQVTSKGNGSVSLLNLRLKVIDGHLDADIHEPTFLHTYLVDLNADGFRDLVVCGQIGFTEDECDCIVRWEPVIEVFMLDAARRRFVPTLPGRLVRIDCD